MSDHYGINGQRQWNCPEEKLGPVKKAKFHPMLNPTISFSGHWVVSQSHPMMPQPIEVNGGGGKGDPI